MKRENSFFSFFSNIKDKINSFFTSVSYSSKNDIKDLNYIIAKKQNKLSENNDNNYISYLIGKKEKNNINFRRSENIQKELNHRYSLAEDYNLSSTFSEISSKENYNLNDTQIESNNDNESLISYYNNNVEEEQNYYYRNNSNILGKKHSRYQFKEENIESLYHQESEQKDKAIKNNNKNKKSKTINEKNYKDVKRLSDEFCSYKKKLKLKNKINKKFQNKIRENDQINIKNIQINENKTVNKKPFNKLFSTNPERFSLYSTQKKMKLDKKESYHLSITTENNIIFYPCPNKNEIKQENKTNGKLNISPVKSCEISKITNISNDFSFRESNDTKYINDVNLSTLIDDDNNSSYQIKNSLDQNITFSYDIEKNNAFPPLNNSYNNSFITTNNKDNIDLSMDIEEYNPLAKNQKENNEGKKNIKANSLQITTNNNPFLFPSNTFEKKIENIIFNNKENVNNNKPFFEGKNLFNINGNNNNMSSGLNFSFGKV